MNITVALSINLERLVVATALKLVSKFAVQLVITTTQLVAATATNYNIGKYSTLFDGGFNKKKRVKMHVNRRDKKIAFLRLYNN